MTWKDEPGQKCSLPTPIVNNLSYLWLSIVCIEKWIDIIKNCGILQHDKLNEKSKYIVLKYVDGVNEIL